MSHPHRPVPPPTAGRAIPIPPVICPFVVIQDSREQSAYRFAGLVDDADEAEADPFTFDGLQANADKNYAPIIVTTVRTGIPRGDYAILGLNGEPGSGKSIVVERKSKADLYGSVSRRENFEGRLRAMTEKDQRGHVVIEASIEDVASNPPRHSKLHPKSLMRTINSWSNDYPVIHWWFLPNRQWAEAKTFRLLEDWHRKHRFDIQDVTVLDQATGKMVRSIPSPLGEDAVAKPPRARKPRKSTP